MRLKTLGWVVSIAVAAAASRGLSAAPPSETPRNKVMWPSPEYRTLQAAIDAVPEGGTLRIRPGVHHVPEPLFVIGKHIVIEGTGCREDVGLAASVLVGPRRAEVAEPSRAVGLLNYRNHGGGVLRGLDLSGFDAAVLLDDRDATPRETAPSSPGLVNPLCPPPALEIVASCLHDTGRGVLAYTGERIAVQNSKFRRFAWNGISLVGLGIADGGFSFENLFLQDAEHIGILIKDSPGVCDACHTVTQAGIGDCLRGGLVAVRSGICISDSFFAYNSLAAIGILQSAALVQNTSIVYTQPIEYPPGQNPPAYRFGDGIVVAELDYPSEATILDTWSSRNSRAGLSNFGSDVSIGENTFGCNGFDLDGEKDNGYDYQFQNLGGNECGCPPTSEGCVVQSSQLAPPEIDLSDLSE